MIPSQIMQQIQQLAQAAGQSVQNFIASNPDTIDKIVSIMGCITLGNIIMNTKRSWLIG